LGAARLPAYPVVELGMAGDLFLEFDPISCNFPLITEQKAFISFCPTGD
jgi:hypothetical protein